MRHEYDNLFQYGLKDDILVHVNEVANGLLCNCRCPNCGEILVAHNNSRNKKAHHFQHKSLKDCTGAYETIIHLLAKEIIQEQGYLTVPDVDYTLSEYAWTYQPYIVSSSEQIIRSKRIQFDKIELEKSVGSFRPDLKCLINKKTLYVEIAVTHFVDQEKRDKIFKDGNPVLEIDLSNEKRFLTKAELSQFLTQVDRMKWINNPKVRDRFYKKEKTANEIREFIIENAKTLKVYGKDHSIYNCPINLRHFYDKVEKIKLEDKCFKCRCLVTEMEGVSRLGDEPEYPSRSIDCIGHVEREYINLLKSKGIYVKT